jgi:hypothetical protein
VGGRTSPASPGTRSDLPAAANKIRRAVFLENQALRLLPAKVQAAKADIQGANHLLLGALIKVDADVAKGDISAEMADPISSDLRDADAEDVRALFDLSKHQRGAKDSLIAALRLKKSALHRIAAAVGKKPPPTPVDTHCRITSRNVAGGSEAVIGGPTCTEELDRIVVEFPSVQQIKFSFTVNYQFSKVEDDSCTVTGTKIDCRMSHPITGRDTYAGFYLGVTPGVAAGTHVPISLYTTKNGLQRVEYTW